MQLGVMMALRRVLRVLLLLPLGCISAFGVVFYSTDDPAYNTTPPDGILAGSGWQYEASFGPFLATAIGPHHFITAKHIGIPDNFLTLGGVTYTITQWFDDPGSELRIIEVAETVPDYAPLYFRSDEQSRNIVVIGRGTQRGDPVYANGKLCGWQWGVTDMVQRWGENEVAEANGYTLYATFDRNAGPNEAHLTSGDSGGAMFMQDGDVWKLAGINFSVDGPFQTALDAASFNAALFDARGLYNLMGELINSSAPAPSGFYGMRISNRIEWIYSIVFPGTPVPVPAPTPVPTPAPKPTPTPRPPTSLQILSPTPDSTLPGNTATFVWGGATNALSYSLTVGSTPGSADIYRSGKLKVRSVSVGNLPTNGEAVYVRVIARTGRGRLQTADSTYAAYSYNPDTSSGAATAPSPSPTPRPARESRS